MKTTKTMFVVVVAFFAASAVMAVGAGSLKVNMNASNEEMTTVDISSATLGHIEIELTSASGKTIYSMETDAPMRALKKKYDFSKLEDGTYWYTVKIDNESTVNKFQVVRGKIEITEVRKSIDPFFNQESKILKMTYLNPQRENVEIIIYDKYNDVVSEASLGNDFALNKAIDFSKNRFGDYRVVLTNGTDIYEQLVTIE